LLPNAVLCLHRCTHIDCCLLTLLLLQFPATLCTIITTATTAIVGPAMTQGPFWSPIQAAAATAAATAATPSAAATASVLDRQIKKSSFSTAQHITGDVQGLASLSCITLALKEQKPKMLERVVPHMIDFLTRQEWRPEQLIVSHYRRCCSSFDPSQPSELRSPEWLRKAELYAEYYWMTVCYVEGAADNDPRCLHLLKQNSKRDPATAAPTVAALVCQHATDALRQIMAEYRIQGFNATAERVADVADLICMERIVRYQLFMTHSMADNASFSTDRQLLSIQLVSHVELLIENYYVVRKRAQQTGRSTSATTAGTASSDSAAAAATTGHTTTAATAGKSTSTTAASGCNPNEAELRAYCLVLRLQSCTADQVAAVLAAWCDIYPDLALNPWMTLAAKVVTAVQMGDYKQFFNAFREAPLLFRVAMFGLVQWVREQALLELSHTVDEIDSHTLMADLGFSDKEELMDCCSRYNLKMSDTFGVVVFNFCSVKYGQQELFVLPKDASSSDRVKPYQAFQRATDGRCLVTFKVSPLLLRPHALSCIFAYIQVVFDVATATLCTTSSTADMCYQHYVQALAC
jgi:SAC3/GANP family